jgi:hypothetical protein
MGTRGLYSSPKGNRSDGEMGIGMDHSKRRTKAGHPLQRSLAIHAEELIKISYLGSNPGSIK